MLNFNPSKRFLQDMKRAEKRGLDVNLVYRVIERLLEGNPLDRRHRDHALKGDWLGYRECHALNDWLVVYRISGGQFFAVRAGSHADLNF